MALTGELFVASKRVRRDGPGFKAVAAATGSEIEPSFSIATTDDVETAAAAAEAAFPIYANLPREERAKFLEAIAEEIEALGDELVERAMQESGLPQARLIGERGRTAGQLRLFAKELRLGDYLRARIDHGFTPGQIELLGSETIRTSAMLSPNGPDASSTSGALTLVRSMPFC